MQPVANLSLRIKAHLSPDLLKKEYRDSNRPFAGHCYISSETLYHLLGGKSSGCKPMFIRHEGLPHWWIKGPGGEIWDLTAEQFITDVSYERSISKGFLTRKPSKRAKELIRRVLSEGI